MKNELLAEYHAGRFDMAITMAAGPIAAAASAANFLYQTANDKKALTAGDILVLRQHRMALQRAIATLDEVIEPHRPRLMAAE